MKASSFHTRSIANQGEKMFLTLPEGEPSEQYLIIRHFDCDSYKRAKMEALRDLPPPDEKPEDKVLRRERIHLNLLLSLVAGWSFEDEFNDKNVLEFLRECPSIADEIDLFAGKKENFFKKAPKS